MKRKWIGFVVLAMAVILLYGCSSTVYEMYRLPKRSEEFTNLQSIMDQVMVGLEYCAPISGENQQTVQMADLNGDGINEHILFAKGTSDKPLQIFIFTENGDEYILADTISCNGSAFEQVEYVRMNGKPGYEMVVGSQVSDQVVRSVSVYTMVDGVMEQILTTNYSKFICNDLNSDAMAELMILRPGDTDSDNGIAELYSFAEGEMSRSAQVNMSAPADKIKRIILGRLEGGRSAVFVASDVLGSAIITDVYAVIDGTFSNVSFSNESGTSVQTLRNYYVYADDIDSDGVLELPSLISMPAESAGDQHIIRWYSMMPDGTEVDKMYTYHNFVGGWYLQLDNELASRFSVVQKGNSYEFSIFDDKKSTTEKLMTIYMFTGQKREEMAQEDNRFVVFRDESVIFAANLEVASAAYNMTKGSLTNAFHLILQDWKTGET